MARKLTEKLLYGPDWNRPLNRKPKKLGLYPGVYGESAGF